MIDFPHLSELIRSTNSKILMVVVDGFGGASHNSSRRSELDVARVPNMDRLAQDAACGLSIPVAPGVTPGSVPGHLALFGYDPLRFQFGRGVVEAMGVGMDVEKGDLFARGNLAQVDGKGILIDRRAGHIPTDRAISVLERLNAIQVDGVDIELRHVEGYRFVARFRGDGLNDQITETDPQYVGVKIPEAKQKARGGQKTAKAVNAFVQAARDIQSDDETANAILLRGWSSLPDIPSFVDAYQLKPAGVAVYPTYRGIAAILGMQVLATGDQLTDEIATVREHWDGHDFFYIHYKDADLAAESGDFQGKKRSLEQLDNALPSLIDLKPDVFILAGDHSSPSAAGGHSWHPVPFMLRSQWTRDEGVDRFNERELRNGSLGQFEAKHTMMLALAHAGKLLRYGA